MTVKTVQRQLGIGAYLPMSSTRRRVEPEDIAFALAAEGRMGWQTIAKIRGVNEADLREACAGSMQLQPMLAPVARTAVAPRAIAVAGAKAPRRRPSPKELDPQPTRQTQVLAAIQAGDVAHDQIAGRIGITRRNSIACVSILRGKGLVANRAARGWRLTAKGIARLKSWVMDGE